MPPFNAVEKQVPYLQGEKIGELNARKVQIIFISVRQPPKVVYIEKPNYGNPGGH